MSKRESMVTIDVTEVVKLAEKVGQLSSDGFKGAAASALNKTIDDTYEVGRKRIAGGINLSDDYLRTRMRVDHASGNDLSASITASGSRQNMTRLMTYDGSYTLVSNVTKRAPGRPVPRYIPDGKKQSGVQVTVKRGAPKHISTGFILPLTKSGGDKFGVFLRIRGKLSHRYGPSVYQLFGHITPELEVVALDDLENELFDAVEQQINRTFT